MKEKSLLMGNLFPKNKKSYISTAMTNISKSHLRSLLQQTRDYHKQTEDLKDLEKGFLTNLLTANIVPRDAVIGSYWPVRSEADVRPILTHYYEQRHICALPVVQESQKPLVFRKWSPGNLLVSGTYNILTPDDTAQLITPTILFVPVLGFDRQGHRLGHGEGYYDRTLEYLRMTHTLTAIGIAFDWQEVETIPHEPHDQTLDYVVTPTRILEVRL